VVSGEARFAHLKKMWPKATPFRLTPIYQCFVTYRLSQVFAGLSRFSLPFNKKDREVFSLSKLPQQY
jgi:hypothetical protein